MIRIDQELTIEGVTVYRDETQRNKFYVLPNQPRFRLDDAGLPVFKFIKYRQPIDRPDGSKGGGFVVFDAEFVVPEDKMKKVQAALDAVVSDEKGKGTAQIGEFTYTRGTSTLQLLDSAGTLVEKIMSAGKPSLYGHNVSCFTAELSPMGATVVESAMQGNGGVAQVIYDLHFITKVPRIGGHVWFRAEKFYSFWQSVSKTERHWWNSNKDELKDTRREQFRSSDSGGVDFEFNWVLPDADQDKKLKDKIRDWGWSTLDDAVKRLVLTDPTANTDTGLPDGVNYVTRDFSTDKTASFDRYFSESDAVEWGIVPQGTLPNITSLPGVEWKNYAVEVDGNDPFFQTLNVNVGVNADFAKLGIDSVDFWINYDNQALDALKDSKGVSVVPHFTSPDQRISFSQYIANNNWKYTYGYQVQYKGSDQVFKSPPIESDAKVLTIAVGELGLLSVEVIAGGINFDQVARAEVILSYEDRANNVAPIEERFTITKTDTQFHWLKVIKAKRAQPVSYSVRYTMIQGDEFTVANQLANAPEIYIDDPFYTRAVHVRSLGDFTKDLDTIFLDLMYEDSADKFTQKASPALSKAQQFFDWTFPVLTGSSGAVTYAGRIKFQDGTEEEIKPTTATVDTIYIASTAAFLEANVIPDLLDWTQVKLVTVSLHYTDTPNGVEESKSMPVKANAALAPWRVKLKDKAKKSFTWSATYYLTNSTTRRSVPVTTDDTSVVLQLPGA